MTTALLDPLSVNLPLGVAAAPQLPIYPKRRLFQQSDHPDDYILEIDYSSMSRLMECARQYENYAVKGREGNKDHSAMDFGKLFHKCEEVRLLHGYNDETRKRQAELIAEHFLYHPVSPSDHRTADRMHSVLKLYYEKWANDGWEKKVFNDGTPFIERPFKVRLCTIELNADIPYYHGWLVANSDDDYAGESFFHVRNVHVVYTGKADIVLEDSNMLWDVDNKTSSRGGPTFFEAFRLSNQTRGYCWAVQKLLQRQLTGVILNAIIIRPLTKTGTGQEFERRPYFYSQDLISEWEHNAKAHVANFLYMLRQGYFPQHSLSFKSPCDGCDYAENCTLPREQRAADLASDLYRDVTWSPINE